MTALELRQKLRELSKSIGPKAHVFVSLADYTIKPLAVTLQPKGYDSSLSPSLRGEADTLDEALSVAQKLWDDHVVLHDENLVHDIALEIISQTLANDYCSDASLRAKFDAAEIARCGPAAIKRANEMADKGPFSILEIGGANDRAAA